MGYDRWRSPTERPCMSALPRVRLTTAGNSHHSHQVIAGFLSLASAREIDLRVEWSRLQDSELPSESWVLAEADGVRIAYDTDDGDVLDPEVLDPFAERLEVLWRRSHPLTPRVHYRTVDRHRPLGLNYHATLRAPYFRSAAIRSNRGLRRIGALVVAERDRADRLRAESLGSDNGTILFQTRLWDPIERTSGPSGQQRWSVRQRESINRDRIALLRALRTAFGERFRGGLAPSSLAQQLAPDLVTSRTASAPGAFLRAAGRARVCVTSRGLWDSNGWKLAEFLGLGRATVAERPLHCAPGLTEGRHFLGFGSVGEALDAVRVIDEDATVRGRMQADARAYFDTHIEPAALVRRSLRASVGFPNLTSANRDR